MRAVVRAKSIIAAGAVVLLVGCGSGVDLSEYSQEEIDHLRSIAASSSVEYPDELLLDDLRSRSNCRVLIAAVDRMETGGEFFASDIESLPDKIRADGDEVQADVYADLLEQARAGDFLVAQRIVAGCRTIDERFWDLDYNP